ncbi:MAG: hypothetical protein ISR65_17835 [Bacteriovoracaceae bacterium]|nr:hypothetical protein [Bacteriovoracaceae bacterium]
MDKKTNIDVHIGILKQQLKKSLESLEHSYGKVSKIKMKLQLKLKMNDSFSNLSLDDLETFEAFAARFARVCDLFMVKLMRSIIRKEDPLFRSGVRDSLNAGEQLGIILDAKHWVEIREINSEIYEYTDDMLMGFYDKLFIETPYVLRELHKLCD